MSDRIPEDNFYGRLRETLDLGFLYKDTKELYGRIGSPSIDPVVFFRLLITGYLENITSDRKLVEHCGMRMDVLYFLGYDLDEELPWHSTISRTRQLCPESLFVTLFNKVFALCIDSGMVSGHTQAVDSAPIKANASMDSVVPKMPATPMESHLNNGISIENGYRSRFIDGHTVHPKLSGPKLQKVFERNLGSKLLPMVKKRLEKQLRTIYKLFRTIEPEHRPDILKSHHWKGRGRTCPRKYWNIIWSTG